MTRTPALPTAALILSLAAVPAAAGAGELSLRDALARGLAHNLDLRVEEIGVPLGREDVVAAEAAFDPEVGGGVDLSAERVPVSSSGSRDGADFRHAAGADVGVTKRFTTGLESRLALETLRASGDPASERLDPRYRSFLVLDLTQPLLRDRGPEANTAGVREARNRAQAARYQYLDRAVRVGEQIELAYYELGLAQEVLTYREESRRLAAELLDGNRQRFAAGVVPITEVQQAEAAVAARDEQVVLARQGIEGVSARLRDLLEIRTADPGGLAAGPLLEAVEDFPGLEAALSLALAERPDLKARRLELESRDIRLAFEAGQRLPRLDLLATLGLNGLSGDPREGNDARFEGGYGDSLSRLPEGDGYAWFAGLRFAYPLGNRAADARHRQAQWEKRQAVYALKRLEGTAQTEIEQALVDARRGLERYRVAQRSEGLAASALAQENARLVEGLSDTFRVLSFQDDVIQARLRRQTALADFHRGLATLYRAMGTNLGRHGIVAELGRGEDSRGTL